MINLERRKHGWPFPGIENGGLTTANPPTANPLRLWQQAAIGVRGRPDPRDDEALIESPIQQFLLDLVDCPQRQGTHQVHFVTAREMVNIALAACDGRSGNPGQYRN